MRLHPVGESSVCPHCGGRPLQFVGVYNVVGDKYRCGKCGKTVIHYRRKGTAVCGLAPLLGFGILGSWKKDACQSPTSDALATGAVAVDVPVEV